MRNLSGVFPDISAFKKLRKAFHQELLTCVNYTDEDNVEEVGVV